MITSLSHFQAFSFKITLPNYMLALPVPQGFSSYIGGLTRQHFLYRERVLHLYWWFNQLTLPIQRGFSIYTGRLTHQHFLYIKGFYSYIDGLTNQVFLYRGRFSLYIGSMTTKNCLTEDVGFFINIGSLTGSWYINSSKDTQGVWMQQTLIKLFQ